MEYPNFITAGTTYKMPEGIRAPEMVTIHEFGHQYFMLLLASNEFEEPFLDEGFNTYYETRTMDFYYGEKSSLIDLFGYRIGDTENTRAGYTGMSNPKIGKNSYAAWEFNLS